MKKIKKIDYLFKISLLFLSLLIGTLFISLYLDVDNHLTSERLKKYNSFTDLVAQNVIISKDSIYVKNVPRLKKNFPELLSIYIFENDKIIFKHSDLKTDIYLVQVKNQTNKVQHFDKFVYIQKPISQNGRIFNLIASFLDENENMLPNFIIFLISFLLFIILIFLYFNWNTNKYMQYIKAKFYPKLSKKIEPISWKGAIAKVDLLWLEELLQEVLHNNIVLTDKNIFIGKTLDELTEAVIVMDEEFKIIYANNKIYHLIPANLKISNMINLLFGDTFTQIKENLIKNKNIGHLIFEKKIDNQKFILELQARIIKTRNRKYYVLVLKDVTEIVQKERNLSDTKRKLEKLNQSYAKKILQLDQERLKNEKSSFYRYFLLETISELSRIDDPKKIGEILLKKMNTYFQISFGAFYLYNSSNNIFELVKYHFFSDKFYKLPETLNGNDDFLKRFFNQNFPYLIQPEQLEEISYLIPDKITGIQSQGLMLPVSEQDRPLGIIIVFKPKDILFIMEEINVLDALAKHISIILLNRILMNELNKQNKNLEKALDELKKSQNQILQLQKMESLGRLVGGIAHDFNNILGIIVPTTELLYLSNNLSEEDKEKLEMIRSAAVRGSELTKQLLIFSREQKSILTSIDLNEFVKNNLNLFSKFLDENIQLAFKPYEKELWIKGDENQIFQVMSNLIINSVDAIKEVNREKGYIEIGTFGKGHPILEKYAKESKYGHDGVGFYIYDNGCGISEENKAKIFDPFFTTKDIGKGTGLGLSIVYAIISNQHKGEIFLNSHEGKDTQFIFIFPPSTSRKKKEELYASDFLQKGTEKILVIDDEEFVRLSLRFLLEKLGYKVLQAENGLKGIELLQAEHDIDLAIVDYAMPFMNGFETILRLKKISPDLGIILSTGYLENLDKDKKSKYIDEIVLKPFDIYEMSMVVRKVLDKTIRKSQINKEVKNAKN